MKTATVHEFSIRDIRQSFHRALKWIENGEEVLVTKHRKVVAKIIPALAEIPRKKKMVWPDFEADQRAIFGDRKPDEDSMVLWARKRERF